MDFNEFEDLFKLSNITLMDVDIDSVSTIKLKKKPEKMSLLDPNRMRNVGRLSQYFLLMAFRVGLLGVLPARVNMDVLLDWRF